MFVIGENPATPLRDEFDSFDQYWEGLTADPAVFQRAYQGVHSGGSSKTSYWVNSLIHALDPINVLMTNVCWYPAGRFKSIPASEKERPDRLQGLIAHCHPKVIFAHGRRARRFIEERFGVVVDPYRDPSQQAKVAHGMLFLGYHHFSGQGLRKGTSFEPVATIPKFADRIGEFLRVGASIQANERGRGSAIGHLHGASMWLDRKGDLQ